MTTSTTRSRLFGAALLIPCVLLLWLQPLLSTRLPYQVDLLVHLRWSDQFLAALRDGWLLPRWAYASFDGLGDPTFIYYQPLFYYITSAFGALGLSQPTALLWGAAVPYFMLGVVVYVAVLPRFEARRALAGACFVMCCPVLYFLSVEMAAYPWSLSLPFSLLFVLESTRQQPRPARLAIVLCLLCLSHLLSAMIALFCTGLGRLVLDFPRRTNIRAHLAWGIGVALGLGLACFFIYPAITQLALINPTGWTEGPNFDWRRAFAFPTFTFALYGLRWVACQWPLPLLALGMCLLALRGGGQAQRLAVVGLAALALGSELAYPLYAVLPPLQKLQFPYRFMFAAAVLGSAAVALRLCEGAWREWGRIARAAALALAALYCLFVLYLQSDIYRHGVPLQERTVYMQGRFGQPEYLPAVRGPNWKQYVADGKLDGECRRLGLRCEAPVQRTHAMSIGIEAPQSAAVHMPLFAFPAWSLTVDGQPQALHPDPDTGLPVVQLSPGRHTVDLRWTGLPAEATGRRISLVSLAFLAVLLALGWRRRMRDTGTSGIGMRGAEILTR